MRITLSKPAFKTETGQWSFSFAESYPITVKAVTQAEIPQTNGGYILLPINPDIGLYAGEEFVCMLRPISAISKALTGLNLVAQLVYILWTTFEQIATISRV